PTKTALVVQGTLGNDTIVFTPGGNTGDISVKLNGASLGTFHPTGRIIAYGLAGDDDIQVAGSIDLSAWLFGGDGNDRLKGGSGPRLNGNTFLPAHTTVLDDGIQDVLTGSSGQDWFWANYKGTGALDKITDLSAAEFANDLDFINS